MYSAGKAELLTGDVRLVGQHGKDQCSPMFLYMEWSSPAGAQQFVDRVDQQQTPQGIQQLLGSLAGDKPVQAWSCSLLAETLATADERTLKELMSQGQEHACPPRPPPPYMPPPPPHPSHQGQQAQEGEGESDTESVASSQDKDNPLH